MKIVGRKAPPKSGVRAIDSLQKMANQLRKGRAFMPKGVWRFKSFEEADTWKLKMMTRR